MTIGSLATRFVVLALCSVAPAVAADLLPLTAPQKKNLGIATAAVTAPAASPALTYPARVTLPPASVRVVAAAGDALVTQVLVQAGESVKRGTALVTLSMPGLADAQSALIQARLASQLATSKAARDDKLFGEGLIAESRLRATQSEAQSARASLSAAQMAMTMMGTGKRSLSGFTVSRRASKPSHWPANSWARASDFGSSSIRSTSAARTPGSCSLSREARVRSRLSGIEAQRKYESRLASSKSSIR